jgi:hypothetical protein
MGIVVRLEIQANREQGSLLKDCACLEINHPPSAAPLRLQSNLLRNKKAWASLMRKPGVLNLVQATDPNCAPYQVGELTRKRRLLLTIWLLLLAHLSDLIVLIHIHCLLIRFVRSILGRFSPAVTDFALLTLGILLERFMRIPFLVVYSKYNHPTPRGALKLLRPITISLPGLVADAEIAPITARVRNDSCLSNST